MKLVEKYIDQKTLSDLDLEEPFYLKGSEDPNEVEYADNICAETTSASIDDVIVILKELKAKGSNRVYIDVNSDHHGYSFTGVNLSESIDILAELNSGKYAWCTYYDQYNELDQFYCEVLEQNWKYSTCRIFWGDKFNPDPKSSRIVTDVLTTDIRSLTNQDILAIKVDLGL